MRAIKMANNALIAAYMGEGVEVLHSTYFVLYMVQGKHEGFRREELLGRLGIDAAVALMRKVYDFKTVLFEMLTCLGSGWVFKH